MKITAPLLSAVLALFVFPLDAADPARERVRPSPDAKCQAVFTLGENPVVDLDIRSPQGGETLFHAANDEEEDYSSFDPARALWSPDSRVLAVTTGFGHSRSIRLFLRNEEGFSEIPCPRLDGLYLGNSDMTPSKWHRHDKLTIKVSGPMNGKADPDSSHYHGTLEIQVNLKTGKASYLSQNIIHEPTVTLPGPEASPLLEISQIPVTSLPANAPATNPGLLIKASRAPGDTLPTSSVILPGESLLYLTRDGAAIPYLASSDSLALCYRTQRTYQVIAMTRDCGLRLYPDLCGPAAGQILRTKLGKQIFPGGGLEFASPRVEAITSTTVTLSSSVTPTTLGGATKTLTCTLKLQPDATVKLLDWHLSGK